MPVTRITFTSGPAPRPKPKVGDRKTIRGVEHVRQFRVARNQWGEAIGYVVSNGRHLYDWVPAC